MNDIFLAIECGVYRHAILGARMAKSGAIHVGRIYIAASDKHHTVEIVRVAVGSYAPPVVVMELKWDVKLQTIVEVPKDNVDTPNGGTYGRG